MKKRLLLLPLLAGLALTGCGKDKGSSDNPGGNDPVVVDAVTSVKITGNAETLSLHTTMSLSADVVTTGTADGSVKWSSSDPAVATVNASTGVVTPKKVGNVVITATSKFDSSKSDSVSIEVVDHGFAPEYYDEKGFALTYNWSEVEAAIKEFLGEGEYEIIAPDQLESGIYYMTVSGEGAAHIQVVVDGVQAQSYANKLKEAEWAKVYESSSTLFEAVDPSLKYTVSIDNEYDSSYQLLSPTILNFYKSSDVWEESVRTEDTKWEESHYGEYASDEYYAEAVAEVVSLVPFVALGSEYEIEYIDNSIYALFGYDIPDQVIFCDYTLDESFLSGYGKVLTDAEFTYVEEFDYYYMDVENYSFNLYFEWGEYGNTICVEKGLAIFESWPESYVNDYCGTVLESISTVPAVQGCDEYTFEVVEGYDEEDYEPVEYASISAGEITKTAALAYGELLETDGFDVEFTEATSDEFASWFATKGKLVVKMFFVENFDEETEEYDPDNGYLHIYVEGDPTAHEVPGLYALGQGEYLEVEETLELDEWLEVFQLESPVLTFTSSDSTKVSVDESGTITAIEETGEEEPVVITATATVNEDVYTAEFGIIVIPKSLPGASFDFTEGGYDIAGGNEFISYEAKKGSGSSDPATHGDSDYKELRLYDKNTLTISSDSDITSIEIKCNNCSHSKSGADLVASTGTLSETADGYLWTGSAKSVTFTCKRVGSSEAGKQCHIESIVVNEGGSGGGGGSSETVDLESIASEIAEMTIGDADSYYKISDIEYYVGVYWEEEGSMSLEDAVDEASYYTPEEFIYGTEIQTGTDQSGEEYAAMTLTNEEESVFIDIESYVEDGYVCVDFYIYVE